MTLVERLRKLAVGDDSYEAWQAMDEAADEIERLERELAARQWRHIDTAPKDGTKVLIWDGVEAPAVAWWNQKARWFEDDNNGYHLASHWMPLPAPPDAKEI